MTDMNKPKDRGRAESKDVTWPLGQKEPLDAVVSNWTRDANQALDPRQYPDGNPKMGRRQRDAYANSGGNNV